MLQDTILATEGLSDQRSSWWSMFVFFWLSGLWPMRQQLVHLFTTFTMPLNKNATIFSSRISTMKTSSEIYLCCRVATAEATAQYSRIFYINMFPYTVWARTLCSPNESIRNQKIRKHIGGDVKVGSRTLNQDIQACSFLLQFPTFWLIFFIGLIGLTVWSQILAFNDMVQLWAHSIQLASIWFRVKTTKSPGLSMIVK